MIDKNKALIAAYRYINSTDAELKEEGIGRDDLLSDFHASCPSLKELELARIDLNKVDKWLATYDEGSPYSENDLMWHVIELARWANNNL
jgi:hypothetical protein